MLRGTHLTFLATVTVTGVLAGSMGMAAEADAFSWNSPDRAAKVAALIPGRKVAQAMPKPEEFLAAWTGQQVEKWNATHPAVAPDQAFDTYATAEPKDADLTAQIPDHISPWARVLSGKPSRDDALIAMLGYCPLCGDHHNALSYLNRDPKNPFHGSMPCCRQDVYDRAEDYPADAKLKPTRTVKFAHLDGTVKDVPGCTVTDKEGVVWEVYPGTVLALSRWDSLQGLPLDYLRKFTETGDPLYAHKIAALLDRFADVYYGLPLSDKNDLAVGKDGQPLTRAEWEALPRPASSGDVFGHAYVRGRQFPWARRQPKHAGWFFHAGRELMWVEPFARLRHHPAFKFYSQKKYGDPEALDRKIMTRLMAEHASLMECFPLQFSYQDGAFVELAMLGILTGKRPLFEFAAGMHECVLYNHHFQDGMNGEGAPNYMWLCGQYFIPAMTDPNGWLQIAPDWLTQHPFFSVAKDHFVSNVGSCTCLYTVRGLPVELGDQHVRTFDGRFLTDPAKVSANEQRPSQNWPGYGIGILRVGGPGHRQEVLMNYQRGTGHSHTHEIGLECWVDGVPVMREGNYADYHWPASLDTTRPEIQTFLAMPYARNAFEIVLRSDKDFNSRVWAMQHWAHNTVSIDELGALLSEGVSTGFGDLIAFKGGETPGEPGSRFQVLDCEQLHSFDPTGIKVAEFRRTLLAVEGPDGRPYMLDVLRLRGGQRHALYQSAWAEPVDEHLPPAGSESANFATYLDKARQQPPESLPSRLYYEQIRGVKVHGAAPAVWDLTWKTDYAAYAPCEPDGKPRPRPLPEDVGRVRLRLIGLQQPGDTELVRAKGPWIAICEQKLPNNQSIGAYTGFRDALDYLIECRTATADSGPDGLTSAYVHILEGRREGESSVITDVTPLLPAEGATVPDGVVALKLTLTSKYTDILVFQPQRSNAPNKTETTRFQDGVGTDARYALVRRDPTGEVIEAHLVRGSVLQCGKFSAKTAGDFRGSVVDLVGDLSGTRLESALIVRPEAPWPVGASLVGRQISITTLGGHSESYTIRKATALPDGSLRVDLANFAPFAVGWHQVAEFDPAEPRHVRVAHHLEAGLTTGRCAGFRVWFPEKGRTYALDTASDYANLRLAAPANPAADGIQPGDWLVIYGIQPGATVNVASDLAWQREMQPVGIAQDAPVSYSLRAAGAAVVALPAKTADFQVRVGDGPWQEAKSTLNPQEGTVTLSLPGDEATGRSVSVMAGRPL